MLAANLTVSRTAENRCAYLSDGVWKVDNCGRNHTVICEVIGSVNFIDIITDSYMSVLNPRTSSIFLFF